MKGLPAKSVRPSFLFPGDDGGRQPVRVVALQMIDVVMQSAPEKSLILEVQKSKSRNPSPSQHGTCEKKNKCRAALPLPKKIAGEGIGNEEEKMKGLPAKKRAALFSIPWR